jgi:hypothetical protein
MEYKNRKYTATNPPYQRVFFEFSEEPGSQPLLSSGDGVGGSGSAAADLQQIAFLQGQLRDKDRRIQTISTQLREEEERAQRAEEQLAATREA